MFWVPALEGGTRADWAIAITIIIISGGTRVPLLSFVNIRGLGGGSEGEHLDTGRFGDGLDDEWLGSWLGFFVGLITLFVYG